MQPPRPALTHGVYAHHLHILTGVTPACAQPISIHRFMLWKLKLLFTPHRIGISSDSIGYPVGIFSTPGEMIVVELRWCQWNEICVSLTNYDAATSQPDPVADHSLLAIWLMAKLAALACHRDRASNRLIRIEGHLQFLFYYVRRLPVLTTTSSLLSKTLLIETRRDQHWTRTDSHRRLENSRTRRTKNSSSESNLQNCGTSIFLKSQMQPAPPWPTNLTRKINHDHLHRTTIDVLFYQSKLQHGHLLRCRSSKKGKCETRHRQ